MPARAKSPRHLLACIALLLGVGCALVPARSLAAAATLAPTAEAPGARRTLHANNPRTPIPLRVRRSEHAWRARVLWAFDLMDTASGGRARGWKAPLLIDLRLTQHRRLAHGLDSYAHIDLIRIAGSNPSHDAGDVQTLDNLAAHHAWRLYRAFWQLRDTRQRWTLRLGWQGYDELFGLVPDGADLLNSSFGQIPTGSQAGMPIWPQTAPGISARWHPDAFYMMAGLWSGVPRDPSLQQGWNLPRAGDGALQALELGLSRHARYKLAVGAWRLTRGAAREQAHRGVYALADVTLLNLGRRRLGGFAQWGQTPPLQSPIGRYVGAGLRWCTVHHGRISAGIARAVLSPAFRAQQIAAPRAETAYELTWRLRATPRLTLQPDLQYIVHPALAPHAAHALEIGLRVDGSF